MGFFYPGITNLGQVDTNHRQARCSDTNPALEKLVEEAEASQTDKQQLKTLLHEFAGVFMGRGTWQDLPNQARNPHGVSYPLKIPPQTKRSSRED